MQASRQEALSDPIAWCCDEFRSAVEVTFAMPVNGPMGWLLYGTDAETVSAGLPELRYWAVQYCPFCGARLHPYPADLPRSRAFGFDDGVMETSGHRGTDRENGDRPGPAKK